MAAGGVFLDKTKFLLAAFSILGLLIFFVLAAVRTDATLRGAAAPYPWEEAFVPLELAGAFTLVWYASRALSHHPLRVAHSLPAAPTRIAGCF
jgi:hypothetical protein